MLQSLKIIDMNNPVHEITIILRAYRTLLKSVKKAFNQDHELVQQAVKCIQNQFRNPNGPPVHIPKEMPLKERLELASQISTFLQNNIIQGKLKTSSSHSIYSFVPDYRHTIDIKFARQPCRTKCPDCTCGMYDNINKKDCKP